MLLGFLPELLGVLFSKGFSRHIPGVVYAGIEILQSVMWYNRTSHLEMITKLEQFLGHKRI